MKDERCNHVRGNSVHTYFPLRGGFERTCSSETLANRSSRTRIVMALRPLKKDVESSRYLHNSVWADEPVAERMKRLRRPSVVQVQGAQLIRLTE